MSVSFVDQARVILRAWIILQFVGTDPEQRQLDSGDEHTATPPTLRPPSRVPSHGTRERGRRIETGAAEQAKRGVESRVALTKRGKL